MAVRKKEYKIRYGIVTHNEISDRVLVINPEYGPKIGKYGSRGVKPDTAHYWKLERESGFYTKLQKSIEEHGVLNPIFCNSIEEGTFCRYGTSRLFIATKLKIKLPMIIADYVDRWEGLEELKTEKDVLAKYVSPPALIMIGKEDMRIDGCGGV